MINELKSKISDGVSISKDEALALLAEDLEVLCEAAREIREQFCGESFDICSITNGKSGKCSENCKYCAQSAYYEGGSQEYPLMDTGDILKDAFYNYNKGVLRYSVVTSGRRLSEKEIDKICESYKEVSEKCGVSLCASHGLLDYDDLLKLKKAGVSRYHNNLETSRRFFPRVCTTHSYDDKIKAAKDALRAGLSVCSGGIMGMGETMEDRIDMALDLRDLGIKSIPINILNPIKGTPFENLPVLDKDELKRIIAVYRFILPDSALRLAGGRGLMEDKGRSLFLAGANAAITGEMLTTSGISIDTDMQMIKELGFKARLI